MAVVNLALFFRWIVLRAEIQSYRRAALGVAVIALVFQLPAFSFLSSANEFVGLFLVTTLIGLFKLYLATGVGLHSVQALQIPKVKPEGRAPIVGLPLKELLILRWQGWFVAVFGSLLFMLAFTSLLFWLSDAQPTELVLKNIQENKAPLVVVAMTVLVVAFAEEIVFRLALQNWLSYAWGHSTRSHWAAVLVTTMIWTLAHGGLIEPAWVKYFQIFIMGVVLGLLNQRFGILACIAVHGLFNVIVIFAESWLLRAT